MGKHAVGKWGRGEGLEQKSAAQRAPKKSAPHRLNAKFWCYLCDDEHSRADCPRVEVENM